MHDPLEMLDYIKVATILTGEVITLLITIYQQSAYRILYPLKWENILVHYFYFYIHRNGEYEYYANVPRFPQ